MNVKLGLVGSWLVFAVGCGGASTSSEDMAEDDGPTMSEAAQASAPITNFHQVKRGLYRGAQLDDAGLQYLKALGVKTIIDLRIDDFIDGDKGSEIDAERDGAARLGMTWDHESMSAIFPVDGKKVDHILATLRDRTKQPIYVHCRHGQDRTGLVIGLERVINESWDPARAYDEMKKLGFHPEFVSLHHYFEEKTGYDP